MKLSFQPKGYAAFLIHTLLDRTSLKINSILSRCERKPKFLFQYFWVNSSIWVLSISMWLPFLKPFSYLLVAVFCLILSWFIYVTYVHLWRFSIVQPIHREGRRSFISRNSDAIVIAVISALLGAVAGAAAIKVADRVWPNNPNSAVERDAPQAAQPLAPRPSR